MKNNKKIISICGAILISVLFISLQKVSKIQNKKSELKTIEMIRLTDEIPSNNIDNTATINALSGVR